MLLKFVESTSGGLAAELKRGHVEALLMHFVQHRLRCLWTLLRSWLLRLLGSRWARFGKSCRRASLNTAHSRGATVVTVGPCTIPGVYRNPPELYRRPVMN